MARKRTIKAILPENMAGIDNHIERIANCDRKIQEIETELNNHIASFTRTATVKAKILEEERTALEKGIAQYAKRNRSKLTQDGKTKTVFFPHGEISWRESPYAVSIKGGVKPVIERMEKAKLDRFVKVTKSLKRDAMLRERDVAIRIKGVSIERGDETFTIKYYESKVSPNN